MNLKHLQKVEHKIKFERIFLFHLWGMGTGESRTKTEKDRDPVVNIYIINSEFNITIQHFHS